jgi:hypothetical protein
MRRWMPLTATAMALMALMTMRGAAEACSCPPEPSAAEALRIADAVFEGTIVDQRAVLVGDGICSGAGIEYDVMIKRSWKGVSERRITLVRESVCAPSFRVGSTELIYADWHQGKLTACACLPTTLAANAAEDIAQLGAPLVTFEDRAIPVATSMPLSRRIRAYFITGISVYVSLYAWWPDINPSWNILLPHAAILVQLLIAPVFLVRRRWRPVVWLGASTAATVILTIFWLGHTLLRSDWYEPLLTW